MIPHFTIDVDASDKIVTITARSGDKRAVFTAIPSGSVFKVPEHGAGFSKAWLAVAFAARLAVEEVLR